LAASNMLASCSHGRICLRSCPGISAAATGRRLKRHTRPPEIKLAEYRIR
jgi:hypothetical protein